MSDEFVAIFKRGLGNEIRVDKNFFRGKQLIGIRKWFLVEEGGVWCRTKEGVSFKVEEIPDLIAALEKLQVEFKDEIEEALSKSSGPVSNIDPAEVDKALS